jgi:hypothetical protein
MSRLDSCSAGQRRDQVIDHTQVRKIVVTTAAAR